jgi:hypothetical protein
MSFIIWAPATTPARRSTGLLPSLAQLFARYFTEKNKIGLVSKQGSGVTVQALINIITKAYERRKIGYSMGLLWS